MFNSVGMRNLFLAPFCIWAGLFIFVPMIFILWYGLTDSAGQFTLDNLATIFEIEFFRPLEMSVLLALVSTVICLILAYPLCLILVERAKSAGLIIILLFVLPMWMNSVLSTMAWQIILEKNGIINQLLRLLSLPDLVLINTSTAIVLGMVYNFLPFMVLPLYVSMSKIDKSVIEAARDLGASALQTFFKVIMPLSFPGAVSGITMVFISSLTTFAISAMLGGGKLLLIGNVIEQEFTIDYNWNLGAALSIVLMIFIVLNMVFTMSFDKGGEE